MIGALLMLASFLVSLWNWLAGTRPSVMRSGEAPITGANWFVSAWADWQQCRDYAKKRSDPKGLRLSRSFLVGQLGFVTGFVLLLCGI
jgi:hypothetical protein